VQNEVDALLATMGVDPAKQRAHLDELALALKDGDIRRGQALFNSAKAACSTCHMMGYVGGNLGPDLTRVGQIRTERDLLEAVVYPSASFVRNYEPILVTTKSGEIYQGNLREEGNDSLVLAIAPGSEVRLSRTDVAEIQPGSMSLMPQGLDQVLSKQELADLIAFLKGTRG
jgi:putative heme-binding domain-containing protein